MGYEAKRLYGHSIWFYEDQFKKLQKLGDHCEIIIIEDDNPNPASLIPMSRVKPNKVTNNILIRVVQKNSPLPVYPETKSEVDTIGPEIAKKLKQKSVSYNDIIKYLINSYKEKKQYSTPRNSA